VSICVIIGGSTGGACTDHLSLRVCLCVDRNTVCSTRTAKAAVIET
jgi:hypothetical protein